MSNFEISIESLYHGWADMTIVINDYVMELTISYTPCDSLLELLESAIRLGKNEDSEVVFELEPKKIYLGVRSLPKNSCAIQIDDSTTILPAKAYMGAILKMFDRYVCRDSREGYSKKWQHGFPTEIVEKLRMLYRNA